VHVVCLDTECEAGDSIPTEQFNELRYIVTCDFIYYLFKAFVRSETEIVTFKGFMDIMQRIKREMIDSNKKTFGSKKKKKEKETKSKPGYKIGNW
jgi:hypothetical protein